jgi:predicted nucleotidyltransferase
MFIEEVFMVMPDDTLPPSLDEIKSRLAPFCRRHGVARLEVFGSVARGDPHGGSDIDLLVTFRPEVHLGWDFFELHREIEEILGCRVDLLTRRSVEQDENAIRRRSILQSTREIYAASDPRAVPEGRQDAGCRAQTVP